ncbi:MAG: 50S ribosomal protein L22 [Candidatus Woesearchaeota archaeon]
MVTTNYSFKNFDDHTAKAYGKDLDISTKASISICNVIRGMDAKKAVEYLQAVVDKKKAVPFTRFTDGVGHRKGRMAAGRYPVKAARSIGRLVASAMSNAAAQGMDENLKITHICAQKASQPLHQGRQIRRSMKRTHVEIVLREDESAAKAKRSPNKQAAKKSSSKKTTKKAATKKQAAGDGEQGSENNVSKTVKQAADNSKADQKSSEVSQ